MSYTRRKSSYRFSARLAIWFHISYGRDTEVQCLDEDRNRSGVGNWISSITSLMLVFVPVLEPIKKLWGG